MSTASRMTPPAGPATVRSTTGRTSRVPMLRVTRTRVTQTRAARRLKPELVSPWRVNRGHRADHPPMRVAAVRGRATAGRTQRVKTRRTSARLQCMRAHGLYAAPLLRAGGSRRHRWHVRPRRPRQCDLHPRRQRRSHVPSRPPLLSLAGPGLTWLNLARPSRLQLSHVCPSLCCRQMYRHSACQRNAMGHRGGLHVRRPPWLHRPLRLRRGLTLRRRTALRRARTICSHRKRMCKSLKVRLARPTLDRVCSQLLGWRLWLAALSTALDAPQRERKRARQQPPAVQLTKPGLQHLRSAREGPVYCRQQHRTAARRTAIVQCQRTPPPLQCARAPALLPPGVPHRRHQELLCQPSTVRLWCRNPGAPRQRQRNKCLSTLASGGQYSLPPLQMLPDLLRAAASLAATRARDPRQSQGPAGEVTPWTHAPGVTRRPRMPPPAWCDLTPLRTTGCPLLPNLS